MGGAGALRHRLCPHCRRPTLAELRKTPADSYRPHTIGIHAIDLRLRKGKMPAQLGEHFAFARG